VAAARTEVELADLGAAAPERAHELPAGAEAIDAVGAVGNVQRVVGRDRDRAN
jgi:hypothetical protein